MLCCWRRRARVDDGDEYFTVHHRRLNRHHASVTAFCLITASILFIFIALSLPIIKSVYLLQLEGHPSPSQPATSLGTQLRFGVWGFCVTSALDRPTLFTNNGDCIGPQLGYTIDPTLIAGVTNEPELANLILKVLTILLVLHPVAACLAFLTVLPVATSCFVFHRAPWIISLILSIATAIMSTIVFAIDLALVLVARNKLKAQKTYNVTIDFGNGVWIVFVSMLFTWAALILLSARVCGCFPVGSPTRSDVDRDERANEVAEGGEKW